MILRLEEIEHAKLRALAQIILDKEKGVEAFQDYMKTAFPYLQTARDREKADWIAKLKEEIGRGAMSIKPLWENRKVRSRLSAKAQEAVPEEGRRLYKKMGTIIPR